MTGGNEVNEVCEQWRGKVTLLRSPQKTSSVDTDPRKPVLGSCKHCASTRALFRWCCHSYRLSQKTLFPTVIYNSQLFSWVKDVFTQVRITNSKFLRFCFYEDRSWWIKHWKRMYNTIKLCFGALLKKEVLCAIKYIKYIILWNME